MWLLSHPYWKEQLALAGDYEYCWGFAIWPHPKLGGKTSTSQHTDQLAHLYSTSTVLCYHQVCCCRERRLTYYEQWQHHCCYRLCVSEEGQYVICMGDWLRLLQGDGGCRVDGSAYVDVFQSNLKPLWCTGRDCESGQEWSSSCILLVLVQV